MDPNLIFDVGLHKGEDTEFYLKMGFRVVAVEANPRLCEFVHRRFDRFIKTGQLTIINVAVAEEASPIKFFANRDKSVWGTTSRKWATRNAKMGASSNEITVQGVDFRDILKKFGVPYFMKIDIEGADLLCLEALYNLSSMPQFVSIESDKTSWAGLLREFKLLKSLGYSKFKVVDQSRVAHQQCSSPSKEGLPVAHRFQFGSSGLFGEDAPGHWISEKEALNIYRGIFIKYWLFGDVGVFRNIGQRFTKYRLTRRLSARMNVGWYDTHASL